MTRHKLTIAATAAAFALSLAPVWAQDKGQASPPPASSGSSDKGSAPAAGSRSSTGDTVGSAMPRGGDSGSSSTSSSSGSTMSGTVGSGGSSPMGSLPGNWSNSSGRRAPERPTSVENAQRRGGGSATGRAMPRGGNSGGNSGSTSGSATSATSGGGSRPAGSHERTAVPPYSRPRDGRTATGTVAARTGPVPDSRRGGYTSVYDPYYYGYYDPYYSRYGYNNLYSPYWMPSYGFGFGYFAYDPFLFGGSFYDPYNSGYGSYGYGGGGGSYQVRYRDAGSLRLKVKPSDAQVYIDGYYVGVIDSFDGIFQRLNIDAGSHKVELRAEGYEPVQFEVMVPPGETITYKGELKRIN